MAPPGERCSTSGPAVNAPQVIYSVAFGDSRVSLQLRFSACEAQTPIDSIDRPVVLGPAVEGEGSHRSRPQTTLW
jgi:hypothetical protein